MKLTITVSPFHCSEKDVEIRLYFDDGFKQFTLVEIIPKEIVEGKELISRMLDKQFYEMRKGINKHFAID